MAISAFPRHRLRQLVGGSACALVALGLVKSRSGGAAEAGNTAFVATALTGAGRLRVAAQPGDLGLKNRDVTAIVSRSDGWLVDFWTNRRVRPTAPQLKDVTNADGIWQLAPMVDDGRKARTLRYTDVRAHADRITASVEFELAGAKLALETTYRLVHDRPELVMSTELVHRSGGHVHLKFQETMKWGNADYHLEGQPSPQSSFKGHARWIGRHGLCGDLMWTRLDTDPFHLEFTQSYPGLAPQIVASYALVVVKPGEVHRFTRKLSYEPLPLAVLPPEPRGALKVSVVDEAGRALPAKLSLSGTAGTPHPDFGSDGDESGANRFVWSGTGRFERTLPVGTYRVLATSGPERAAEEWAISISADQTTELAGQLPRLLETPGWISADLHLHQVESVDADLAHSSRLIAVAAEGVELAAATDHYAVSDFAPSVARLIASGQLARPLATMVGSEVSTVGNRFGHFNLFPMQLDDSVNYIDTTPKRMLAEMRKVAPGGVIQVNHPRWPGIGYFQLFQMDPKRHSVPRSLQDQFATDFDAIEVFNGLDAYSHPRIRLVLRDWIALLGRGARYTATGNSDSHKLAFQDPGLPRNFIRHGQETSDAQDVHVNEAAIVNAIKAGRVLVTSGPFIEVDAGGKGPGDTVKSGGKPVTLKVTVRAVPWVDVSRVEVLVGPKAEPLRYVPVPASKELVRYQESIRVPGHGKTFVIVLAAGKRPLPNVHATGVEPLAFTNPIWIEP